MVLYSFTCRKCGYAWSQGSSKTLLCTVKCRRCSHDRLDSVRACSGPPRPADQLRPLNQLQRSLVLILVAAPSSLNVSQLARPYRRSPGDLRRSASAIPRFINCDDAGELTLTDLGRVVAINLRAAGVRD